MTCLEAEPLLNAYLDGELDLPASLTVERHLAECRACEAHYDSLGRLREEIAAADLGYEPSRNLERRIRGRVTGSRPGKLSWSQVSLIAASAAAVVVLFFIIPTRGGMSGSSESREILDSHLRSLMPNHLVDVPSSDRHTVKPWFQGKTSFSPPVPDLTAQGFVLIGGRAEVIHQHPAAAIVYKRREHVINLYVFRADGPPTKMSLQEIDGYHLVRWTANGLSYSAVSDVNPTELQAFAAQFVSH